MDSLSSNPFQANSQQNPTGNRFQQTRVATWNDSGGIGDLNLRISLMPWSQAMRDKVLDYVNNAGIPQQLETRRLEVLDYLGGQADIILSQEHKGKGCDKERKDFPGNQFSMEPRKDSQMNYTTMKREITSSVDDEVVLYRSDLFEKVELPENLNVGTGFAVVMLKNKKTGGFVLAISRHHSFEEDKFNNESNSNNFILKLNSVLNDLNVDMKNLSVVVGADGNISASEEQSKDIKGIHTLLRENGFTIDEGTSNEPTCFFRNTPAHADTIKVKNGFNSKGVRVVPADTLGLKSWAALDQFVPKGEDAGQVVSFGYQTVQVKEFAPDQLDEKGLPKGLREVLVHLFPSDHLPMIMDFMDPAAAAEQFVDILDEMILSPASKKDVNGKEQIPDPAALALRKMLFERKILVEGKNWGNYSKSETLKLARENFSQYIPELKKLHSELIAKLVNDQTKKLNP
ncbi:MAG: hypothetical protein KDK40_01495, partial [Chlamydiia bacterium]|nr:hypothetical protein [Chlamydiia bacterium]